MNVTRKFFERVRITGPMEDSKKAHAYLDKHRYRLLRGGPVVKDCKADMSKMLVIGEREVDAPTPATTASASSP